MDYLEGATLARFGGPHGGPWSPHLALPASSIAIWAFACSGTALAD